MGVRRKRVALAAAGLRPQKRWGQHFRATAVARRIVDARPASAGRGVLEIGPGSALTDELATRAGPT